MLEVILEQYLIFYSVFLLTIFYFVFTIIHKFPLHINIIMLHYDIIILQIDIVYRKLTLIQGTEICHHNCITFFSNNKTIQFCSVGFQNINS